MESYFSSNKKNPSLFPTLIHSINISAKTNISANILMNKNQLLGVR